MIWDIASGEKLQTFPGTQYAVISSNWSVLATRSVGEQVLLTYDLESGRVTHRLDRGVNQGTTGIYISPDGKVLASREQASENKLLLWDTTSGSLLHTLPEAYSTRGFTSDGKYISSVKFETLEPDRVVLNYWDVGTGKVAEIVPMGQRVIDLGIFTTDSDTTIGDLAFSPDGTSIAMGFNDVFLFWDGVQRSPGWTIEKYCLGTCLLTFSPDGKVLAISETVGDFITLYDTKNGEKLAELRGDARWIIGFVFSPDGTRLVSSGKNGVIDIFGIP